MFHGNVPSFQGTFCQPAAVRPMNIQPPAVKISKLSLVTGISLPSGIPFLGKHTHSKTDFKRGIRVCPCDPLMVNPDRQFIPGGGTVQSTFPSAPFPMHSPSFPQAFISSNNSAK